MAEFDWPRVGLEAAGSALSAVVGLLIGVWRWGRSSAQQEQRVKDDYEAKIDNLADELRTAMAALERLSESKLDGLVDQFKETLNGIRRQIDTDRLRIEQNFVRKDDFREMRAEIRADMGEIKRSLAELRNGKP